MTHRSRSGGPQKQRGGKKKQPTRKLHHPPPPPVQEETDELPSLRSAVFLDTPSDEEILKLVHHALRGTLDSYEFSATVQKVKGLLYDKKWLEVFTDQTLLESYAGRWVPSRGCCYRELFAHLGAVRKLFVVEQAVSGETPDSDSDEERQDEEEEEESAQAGPSTGNAQPGDQRATGSDPSTDSPPASITNILSLGGGAASELLAVASLVRASQALGTKTPSPFVDRKGKSPVKWNWTGVDIGAWDTVIGKFRSSLQSEWELEDDALGVDFIQADLLAPLAPPSPEGETSTPTFPPIDLGKVVTDLKPDLTTILFTLTELLTQSRPATISLLRSLTAHTPSGSLLLVADSASDISEFEMGSSGRKWPIYMILDTILLGPPGSTSAEWECVRKEDSRWYRLPAGVGANWPVKLENTRYWYRLYRKV